MNLQQRFEESSPGQVFLSILFIAVIIGVFAWNLPPSRLATATSNTARPFIRAAGLDQNWELFAPVPRESSIDLRADVTLGDGQVRSWHPPKQGLFFEPYRSYRWWKWADYIRKDSYSNYWYQFSLWVAHMFAREHPSSITLVRLWRNSTPPGTSHVDSWHSYAFYTLQLSGTSQ
jgi:hypothetical protein